MHAGAECSFGQHDENDETANPPTPNYRARRLFSFSLPMKRHAHMFISPRFTVHIRAGCARRALNYHTGDGRERQQEYEWLRVSSKDAKS